MSDRASFSIIAALGGKPAHPENIHLYAGTAFKDGKRLLIIICKQPLGPNDDDDFVAQWDACDPRCQEIPYAHMQLSLSDQCRCRTPDSKLALHDLDSAGFTAYMEKLLANGGVLRFLVELEEFSTTADGEPIAHRLTIGFVR